MRDKRRYILVRIFPPWSNPGTKDLFLTIQEAVTSASGDATASAIQMAVVHASGEFAIVRCNRGTEKVLEQALATVSCIGSDPLSLRPVATSGTILSLKEKIEQKTPRSPPGKKTVNHEGKLYDAYCYHGQKIDLLEKGFKSRELLFLTKEDIEEGNATTVSDGL
jgi:ribonuclease P/MRP protein subunit POP5